MSPNTKPAVKVAGAAAVAGTVAWLAIATPFTAAFEGYARKPYVDTVGTGHPITWCYGETKADGTPVPPMSAVFSKDQCTAQLQQKLANVYYPPIAKCIPAKYLTPHRTAALVDFAYNLGPAAVCTGPVGRYIAAGNVAAGCRAMLAYDHANGVRLAGLTRRRQADYAYCVRND